MDGNDTIILSYDFYYSNEQYIYYYYYFIIQMCVGVPYIFIFITDHFQQYSSDFDEMNNIHIYACNRELTCCVRYS